MHLLSAYCVRSHRLICCASALLMMPSRPQNRRCNCVPGPLNALSTIAHTDSLLRRIAGWFNWDCSVTTSTSTFPCALHSMATNYQWHLYALRLLAFMDVAECGTALRGRVDIRGFMFALASSSAVDLLDIYVVWPSQSCIVRGVFALLEAKCLRNGWRFRLNDTVWKCSM